uniref:Tektin n=1 Tax=Parascaris univalens TaxID=6257 RepID=A0A915AGS7_PARUN
MTKRTRLLSIFPYHLSTSIMAPNVVILEICFMSQLCLVNVCAHMCISICHFLYLPFHPASSSRQSLKLELQNLVCGNQSDDRFPRSPLS